VRPNAARYMAMNHTEAYVYELSSHIFTAKITSTILDRLNYIFFKMTYFQFYKGDDRAMLRYLKKRLPYSNYRGMIHTCTESNVSYLNTIIYIYIYIYIYIKNCM
jgi:hypothetical protein